MQRLLSLLSISILLSFTLAGMAFAQCQLVVGDEQIEDTDAETNWEELADIAILDQYDVSYPVIADVPEHHKNLYLTLAYQYVDAGDYESAAKCYLFLLSMEQKDLYFFNLACMYGMMGEAGLATEFVRRAWDAGFDNLEWINQDPDLDPVRDDPAFTALMDDFRAELQANQAAINYEDTYIVYPMMLKARVVLPAGFDGGSVYPLVIGLHGAMDTPERFATLTDYFVDPDFIYVALEAPTIPEERTNGGSLWFGAISPDNPEEFSTVCDLNSRYVLDAIVTMQERYKTDDVYIIGFSQGAAMAYLTGLEHQDVVDGIVAFGGFLDPEWLDVEQAGPGSPRIFIGHGSEDNLVGAQELFDRLTAVGYDVTMSVFDGGHFIHLGTLHEAEEWMHN